MNARAATLLGSMLLGLLQITLGQASAPTPTNEELANGRRVIEQAETEWAHARVAVDTAHFEKALAADFYVQTPDKRVSRKDFIDVISHLRPGVKLTRFDNRVLTVQKDGDHWSGLILEKLEFEVKAPDGKSTTTYALFVTRDGLGQVGGEWKLLFSEVIGSEAWRNGERPPFKDW